MQRYLQKKSHLKAFSFQKKKMVSPTSSNANINSIPLARSSLSTSYPITRAHPAHSPSNDIHQDVSIPMVMLNTQNAVARRSTDTERTLVNRPSSSQFTNEDYIPLYACTTSLVIGLAATVEEIFRGLLHWYLKSSQTGFSTMDSTTKIAFINAAVIAVASLALSCLFMNQLKSEQEEQEHSNQHAQEPA